MGLNHVYKVIWSKTKHCYVVVSELAKRVGRNKVKAAVVQTGTVAAVLAVTALTGSVAQAALNDQGTGSGAAVAWGTGSQATTTDSVAIGKGAKAENANAIAIGGASKSSGDSGIALGNQANAENKYTVAIGRESKASGDRNIALGYQATANKNFAIAIGAGASAQQYNNAVAIGANSQANGATSLALGMESKTTGHDSYAIGYRSETIGEQSIAFGRESKARKKYDIVFGSEANTRDQGQGHSIAIGVGAMSGTNSAGKNLNGGDAGGVAIGTGAYTGVNRTNISLNSSVAVGAGAGAGYRKVDTDGLPTDNATDADNNATVLVKAFGGTTGNLAYFKNAGNANKEGFFSFQNVNINEATALGRNARAIGDQSVAIGAQSVAGQGSIVIGGNDIQAYDGKKYFKAANPTKGAATTVNDYDAETTPGTGKNGQPITITNKYQELVGDKLDNTYRSSYGQDGSTVIGMQAHSTTPLGVAIGTNSIVRKGAFGATAIGSGASVFANAEAAVAIGMGSKAQGNYAVAAGTAASAQEAAVAAGYHAEAEVKAVALGNKSVSKASAVAVGDSSEATNSSVAVGQSAKAQKVADIAVGQGAVASGEQGAIAVGLGTRAQGDSSIMIGGSEITKVAAQNVNYQKEKRDKSGNTVIKTTKKIEHIGGEKIERTIRSVETEAATGSIQDAYRELTNGATLTTTTLDYSLATNKNGHGSISMGIHSLSTGDLGTAIGTGARVTKLGGVALGTGAISELQNGVAIGTGSRADANSIGTRQTDISYDKEGHIVPFDSKKVAYTFYWAGGTNTSEGDVVSFGTPGAERQLKNVAAGRIADDSTDAINGSQLNSVTKRMSSGWSVEGEKDHNSSGVLKLKGTVATGQSVNYAADGKSSTKGETGTATGQIDKVRLNDEVKMRVGDNLVLNQEDASRPVYEDPDNKDRQTGRRITSKFTYSLNPVLKNLTSATFKNDAGDTTVINGAGVTVTPVTTGKQPVSLTTSGLNNGGNAISNVASNLPDTKNNTATKGASNATTSQEAPTLGTGTNQVNPTNAATVSDVLNAGWNLQGNNAAVDFVKPYDTVNFINGDGTTATVESTDGKTSTVKYSVNLGDGLEKDVNNKITVKAADKSLEASKDGVKVSPGDKSLKTTKDGLIVNTADKSLEVTNDGLKVKTDGKTITTDNTDGLKVITGEIEPVKTGTNPSTNTGTVKVKDNDAGKIATVDSVVNAVNNAAWTATSGKAGTGTATGTTAELIKAGNTVTFKAGDNLAIKQAGKEFIYSLNPALSGLTSAEFKDGNNNTVNITPTGITITKPADTATNTPEKTVKLNQDGLDNGGNAITNVKSGLDTYGGNVPGTTDKNTGLVNLSKPTVGEPKVSDNTAATVGDIRNMGWLVSSNKTTGENGAVTAAEYSATVKNANEVKFVGEGSAIVSGKTDGNVRTITVKVDDQTSTNNAVTPVVYTDKDGNRVYPTGKKDDDGNQIFNTQPDGKGTTVTGPIKTTVNGPKGTSTPTTLSNVEGNLVGAKTGTDAPTTSATAPTLGTGTNQVNKNNAATVGDVLQAGWNLQNNGTAKDFVKPYDTVNFVDGEGTTAVVETTTDGKTSTIKYSVNLGNGLQKDTKGNTISVKPADKSLTVGTDGVKVNPGDKSLETTTTGLTVKKADASLETTTNGLKVKTDGKTITTDNTNGLKVVTGDIEPVTTGTTAGTVKVKDNDAGKIATVDTVAKAVNDAAFTLKASATTGGTRNTDSGVDADGESIKAGSTVEMIAGKNLDVKHDTSGKITFATVENPSFNTIQVGGSEGPKFSKTADGNISVSDKDGTEPVKITNVKDGDISKTSKDAINGSQFHAVAKNTIKLAGQNGTAAATETDEQSLDKTGGIKFTVKSSDGALLDVAAAGDTITLTPKTGTITTGTDGVPTATTTGGKLVTADQLVTALTKMGWKATAGQDDDGTVTDATVELIKAGDTVTFKAGNNLAIKQAGKEFIYSLNPELSGLTSAEFKDANKNTVKITPEGITITKPADATGANGKTVTLNQDGLNNGGNAISNVASNLPSTKNSTTTNTATDPSNATTAQAAPNTTNKTGDNYVNPNNAATVGDVLNAGWNLQGNGTAVDFVKPYDTVDFVNGDGTTASVTSTDGKTSTVKYSVNLGNGLEKDADNKITVKPADTSLTVGADGVKVNPGDKSLETTTAGLTVKKADSSLETTTDGLKVKTDGTTITTDNTNGLKVVTGTINNVTTGDTAGTVEAKTGDGDKIATVGNVVSAINNAAWTATSAATTAGELGATAKNQLVKAGDKVTFEADKNIKITQTGSKFTFTTKDNVSFSTVQVGGDQGPKLSKTSDGDLKVSGPNGTDPVKVTNVKSGLDTYGGNVPGTTAKNTGLVDLSKPTKGEPKVSDNTAATVGDIRNMGWVVSSNKTTGANGAVTTDEYSDTVKNANEVKFVGEGSAIVSGKTEGNVRTITVKVDNQTGLNKTVTPVNYTKADGTKVYPQEITNPDGSKTVKFFENPDGSGNEIPANQVITSVNGPEGTTNPTTLSNVKSNLPDTKNSTTANTEADPSNATKSQVAPTLEAGANEVNKNNAATVGDVLNAGWNLQGNGVAKDFVKPYDTVNFVNGDGTTATVESADGKTSTVKYSVNLGNGLEKDANNKIAVKAADGSISSTAGGISVNVDGTTIGKANDGTLQAITGAINEGTNGDLGKVVSNTGDGNKLATVNTVVNAINNAAWTANSEAEGTGTATGSSPELIKAGDIVVYKAGNNLAITQAGKNFTYSLKETLTGLTSAEFKDANKNTVNITPTGITITKPADTTTNTPEKNVKLNQDGLDNGGNAITNVKANLPETQNSNKANTAADPSNATKTQAAPNTTNATGTDYINPNNAATVGDVLNAGWNLQGNGTAVDFVKPYDTVNFVNGLNTTAVVSTVDGVTSNVTYNVTGLPITYTDKDGNPVSKIGDNFYKVNDKGQPLDANGNPSTKVNNDGKPVDDAGNVINPIDTTNNPVKTSLVNPSPEADKTGTSSPTTLDNVTSKLENYNDPTVDGKTPVRNSLVDLSKPTDGSTPKVSDNTVATVGDLRNMGWIVSSDKNTDDLTKDYSDIVKNANEVKFVGEGTAIVSGKTDGNVRTITVKVDDQTSTNNAVTPVVYTDKDGNQVYPTGKKDLAGNQIFNTKPDGKGDTVTGPVKTTVNGPNGTSTPTSLSNVKNNIPTVNDEDKTAHNTDGTVIGGKNNTEAPITAGDAANLLKPTVNGAANPNFVGNNAATVSDVLNAGWNLQNNGTAKDFVKPYDTVNFVNGLNTTAVVTTSDDGTTSNVTYNVTGLPVTYTTADGTPVSKIGDKYYKVNDQGQPVDANGNPATKINENGVPVGADGNPISEVNITNNPLTSKLVNPNVTNTTAEPNKKTTDPTQLGNVTSGLNKYGDTVNGADVPGTNDKNRGLVDLSKPTTGQPKVSDNTVATVGDLRNMGWIVSADKTTDNLTAAYSDTVKNANEVKFVGEGTAIVSGKTDGNVRTITVKVDDQTSTNNAVTPVVYTDKDGNQVYPTGKKDLAGNQIFNTKPDGKGDTVTGPVKTTVNGPKGTDTPTTLSNVEGNLDGAKTNTTAPTTNHVGVNTTTPTAANYVNPHNAATVGDVLQAGWNLQNNGTAKDFVKPYDTVNFVNGANTTAVVTTNAEGTASDVTFNVTGLPVTYTTADGKPVSKVGDKFYTVDESGTPVGATGNKAVGKNATGEFIDNAGNVINPIDTATNQLQSSLVNPNVTNTTVAPSKQTTTPTQLGNVANGAKTFAPVDNKVLANDGKWYNATDVEPNGKPKDGVTPVANPLAPKNAAGDVLEKGNDGKWYKADELTDGTPKPTATEQTPVARPANSEKSGLIDFNNSNPNNAATIGDLQNMGWVVSAEGNSYSDQVRNANEVKFVGEGTAIVTGKTDDKGVRTITVKVDDQTSTNNAVTPVAYTKTDGTQVYPTNKKDAQGNPIFNTKADGSGDEVPNTEVITSVNGPKGTTSPTTLKNVKNNIPNVNDGSKTITNTDGTEKPNAGDVANITKAPLTAAEAAELSNPKTADGAANPKYIGNNAATVSDVLNAGWNLQNNGTAKDFVKPYDTVNFVNGGNTTAVVTTKADGTTSDVTFNVTGLPVATTINTPTGPVHLTKVGDNYYPVKGDGTPDIQTGADGHPTNGYVKANDGNYYPAGDVTYNTDPATHVTTITPNANATPAKFGNTLTNPNVSNTDAAPNNSVSSPTSLGNVKNNLDSVNDGTEVITKPDGTVVNKKPNKENITKGSITAEEAAKLANPKLADGSTNPNYVGNNAATVSDVLNAGFNVQGNGKAVDFVKPYDTVNFRDGGNTTVSVTTDDNLTTHVQVNVTGLPVSNTITDPATGKQVPVVKVGDAFYRANPDGTPNIVRDAAGNPTNGYVQANDGKVYPRTDVDITNNLDGTTTVVPKAGKTPTTVNTNVVNPNVANTDTNPGNTVNTPTTVGNVEGNLEGAKTGTTAPTTSATAPNTTDATQPNYVNTHNAATVGDVLQAGWNLQNNGVAKDFVKPYDTVNFVNGGNTTAVVTTNAEGTASNVTFNVTGLPMTYTTADGTPVSKIGDKYYKVNDKGQPVDANGKPSAKVNNNGEPLDENGVVIQPINTAATPLSSKLVNPNVSNSDAEPNKQTTSPTQLGNVTSGLHKYGDTVDGNQVPGTTPANTGLIDLSKPATGEPKVSDNTAATVGDLRNMGWIVSSDKTTNDDGTAGGTNYTDQVRNANEVKFVGKGTAIVSGKTDANGVRTITVKVDDQVSTNNAIMPTSFTTKDGKKVYPVKDDAGNVTYHTTPDGKGAGDTVVTEDNIVTSVNGPGPNGTTTPTTLQNVKSNLPNVDDKKQKAFNPDGTEVTEAGTTTNTGNAKAPLSHTVVAEMMSPYMMNAEGNFLDADGNITTDPTKYVRNPNFAANNAATVGDVLQAGWNLQNNGTAKDFVKPYDTVNFINGLGTTAVVTTREGNTTSDVTFNVKPANGSVTVDEDGVKVTTGEITTNTNGSVAGPTDPATAKQLKATLDAAVKELATAKDALKTAETALAANPNDPALQKAVKDKKADVAAKQTPVDAAQKAHDDAGLNKIATVQNVAEAINNAGFNLKTSADGGEKLTTGTKNDGELIKPGNTVEMVAGKNLTVKQDTDGKITYATKDDVTFKTVDTGTLNVGSPNTFTDGKGNTYTKVGNDYYNPSDVENGAPKPGATPVTIPADVVVKPVSPVTMKTEAAKPATNNGTDAPPSSALNITSKDGNPTQITGVGSTLNTNVVKTNPEGTATKPGTTPKTEDVHLVDLKGTDDAPVNKNAAATVGDLQNMGWVVSAKDGNGYKDVVKNANVVDFKGGKGIEITGNTLADGTREITVGIKEGEVTNKVTITHGDGTKTDAVKIGDNYYKVDKDGKPIGFDKDENGKPAGTPLTIDPTKDKVTNNGAGFVTGNTVANAIQDSGWNVGKANISDVKKSDGTAVDFNKEAKVYDTVNPNDDVKFVDGANANVSMVTVDALNKDGTKKATTFVKVDVNRDLKIDSLTTGGTVVDKNGNNLVKVGDDYYKESDIDPVTKQPKANAKPVPPAKDGKDLVKVGDKYYEESDIDPVTKQPKADAKPVSPAKDGEMIVKNADGKDVVSATVGKDGSGVFGVNGKDGKDGVSITAKDGEGAIGVNGKDGKNTSITGDSISIKDKDNKNSTEIGINSVTLKDKDGNTSTLTADKSELIDKDGNTNTSTSTTITLADKDKNTNTSTAAGTTYTDKDKNTTTVGPKEIVLRDKDGNNTSKLTNNDLLLNTKDPNTGVEKTSHMSGDKISFTTTDEIEKDSKGNPVIDPKTNQPKIKNPGNSTEYTNEGLKVIPNSTVARDANGNPTFLDKTGKPVMKDTDGKYKYVGQDGKPGKEYTGGSGSLKPNVVDTTRVISFGMDKPVLDANGNPVKGPDGKTVMTEGISAGMQQIHNVAPGTKDTDAVNVSQLKGMANVVMNVNNRVNRVGAQAAALAGLQSLQYDPLEPTQISAGLGYYKGAGALALGVNHFKNESTMFHMGASFNGRGDETMMNASVTWKFGARADETAVKDTFRQGPISASYTLQDKVSALEAQNQIQKDQLNELRATNAAQKAENEAQREELALMKAQIAELFKRMNG